MAIYIILIIIILFLPYLVAPFCKFKNNRNDIVALIGMIIIFFVFALKNESVGIDISGYRMQYDISRHIAWNNFNYVYFEKGYILLQKVFSKIGFNFQFFASIIYAFLCYAWYLFIKKHSKDATLSILIFICYQFFVFDMSGIRQALATAICIFSYLLLDKHKKVKSIFAFSLIALAITIHLSSIVFPIVFILYYISTKNIKVNILFYFVLIVLSIFIRKYIWQFVNIHIRTVNENIPITLGGNFIFLLGITVFIYFTIYRNYNIEKYETINNNKIFDYLSERICFVTIAAQIIFSGNSMLRSSMYFTIFLVPAIPNMISYYDIKARFFLKFAFYTFLIALFTFEVLIPNQLNICPYKFFWQT